MRLPGPGLVPYQASDSLVQVALDLIAVNIGLVVPREARVDDSRQRSTINGSDRSLHRQLTHPLRRLSDSASLLAGP